MKDSNELKHALAQFTGTEGYYFNPMYRWMNYTDGVKFFAENAGNGAYWLLDIVGTEFEPLAAREDFLNIEFAARDGRGTIRADDGNDNPLYSRTIDYTDCPDGTWKFFLVGNVLLIPSEY